MATRWSESSSSAVIDTVSIRPCPHRHFISARFNLLWLAYWVRPGRSSHFNPADRYDPTLLCHLIIHHVLHSGFFFFVQISSLPLSLIDFWFKIRPPSGILTPGGRELNQSREYFNGFLRISSHGAVMELNRVPCRSIRLFRQSSFSDWWNFFELARYQREIDTKRRCVAKSRRCCCHANRVKWCDTVPSSYQLVHH